MSKWQASNDNCGERTLYFRICPMRDGRRYEAKTRDQGGRQHQTKTGQGTLFHSGFDRQSLTL
jgi:hypothetical protein